MAPAVGAGSSYPPSISSLLYCCLVGPLPLPHYSTLSMMVTRGGGSARSAFIHDANGRGPRVPSHASLRMHALAVHPRARRSTRYACTHRSPMHVSPSMRCIHSRCEWPQLVLARTPRPSMHVSPLMRAAARSTHALSLPSHACDQIHRRP